jgi:hypothetical protein
VGVDILKIVWGSFPIALEGFMINAVVHILLGFHIFVHRHWNDLLVNFLITKLHDSLGKRELCCKEASPSHVPTLGMIPHAPGMIRVATRPQENKLEIARGKRFKKA